MDCSVLKVSPLLGKKWAIPILMEIRLDNFENFYQFEKRTTITSRTLSNELKELVAAELITKEMSAYTLTEKGHELCTVIDGMKQWNIKWNQVPKKCSVTSCFECGKFP